jgi:hypothetical protein
MRTATVIEYGETNQANNMFIELTENMQNNLYSNEGPRRIISVNTEKIQAFFPEKDNTVVQLRQESIKVEEDYETVKSLIAISEKVQTNTKGRNPR